MAMTIRTGIKYFFVFSLILLCFFANSSFVLSARVAGENGVTSVAPIKSEQKVQRPDEPAMKNSIELRPAQKKIVRTNKNNARNNTTVRTKKTPEENKPEKSFSIDFHDVDIATFINFVSERTGKNFVIDKGVNGKVTVISPTKISEQELYRVFESVLEVYGFATVSAGAITKVIPAATAKSKNIETMLRKQAISPEDRVVTQLIPLKYANPADLKKLFDPLISKNSLIVPYAPTGTLIVTDVLSNIKRLVKIIEEIDVEGIGEQISVVPLEYATASVLAKSLSTVFQRTGVRKAKGPAAGGTVRITSDERTNALIILASEDDTRKIKKLISLLDTEIPRGEGDIHVYYLQNADAEDLAAVLKAIPSDQKDAAKKGKAPVVSEDVKVVADKATNSLVITANKTDYLVLEDVIKKLDIVRRMVYIEALLMEVSVKKDFDLGVQWQAGKDIGNWDEASDIGAFISSTESGGVLLEGPQSASRGLSLGVLGEGITIGSGDSAITFPSISALINAYEGDSDIHILSTPQIMTTDNEEAEIIVAENIPFLTRQDTSETGTDYSNYDYKDVGTTLNITPQINQDRFVRLKILQEVSQVIEERSTTGLPTTLKRQTTTTVLVKDKQTIVIAGLIGETLNRSEYRVPCLGSIPGLGWLFKSMSDSSDETNLFVFITPHIVENPEEAKEVYESKKKKIERIKEGAVKMYKKSEVIDLQSEVKDEQ